MRRPRRGDRARPWSSSATGTGTASAWGSGDRSGTRWVTTAAPGNYTYGQILSHFYGGTTLETLGTAPAPASFNDGNVIVAMTENNGDDLIATAASGTVSVAGVTAAATAVLFHLIGPGSLYDVYVSGGCAGQGGWQLTGTAVTEPTAVATNGGPVELCQPGPSIEMHGSLTAVATSTGAGPDGQHPPARAVRGRRGAVGVPLDVGHAWAVPGRRARTGASSSPRPRPWPPAPMSRPTRWATAATPTRVTRPASPTRA